MVQWRRWHGPPPFQLLSAYRLRLKPPQPSSEDVACHFAHPKPGNLEDNGASVSSTRLGDGLALGYLAVFEWMCDFQRSSLARQSEVAAQSSDSLQPARATNNSTGTTGLEPVSPEILQRRRQAIATLAATPLLGDTTSWTFLQAWLSRALQLSWLHRSRDVRYRLSRKQGSRCQQRAHDCPVSPIFASTALRAERDNRRAAQVGPFWAISRPVGRKAQ